MSTVVYDQLPSLSANSYKLCLCNNSKIYCCFKKFDECTTKTRGKEYHCILHSSSKNKREVRNQSGSVILQDDDNVLKRTKRQIMSENEAFDACNVAFQQSAFYDTCLESVSDFTNETLENCIIDLTMTGELRLIQLHLDTALGQCQEFILLNYTLQTENPNITTIVVNLCPNNCSNNGLCSEGICTCSPGYGGSDCSFDVSSPPTITQLVGDGVCDKSVDTCSDVTLYGQYFVENMGTNCYFTREEITGSNSVMSATSYSVNLEERTLFEGYCSLQYGPATSWITAFRFNLSNDGTQYSENYTVYVYQSQCQTFQNDSGAINFSLQDGY
uniref:von Willebrand factor D and EGF domain-containing protein-like n=1 Tax=Crassostrea virginica TaxID=6565 RepID=A0A8B8AQN1_CRAVI|nr:von Willebrand factor D and EGF domain-containing protein-like [Crassostrea virginica]